jgi:Raf kinase inhibitor-like YbhB/YbcL family protein
MRPILARCMTVQVLGTLIILSLSSISSALADPSLALMSSAFVNGGAIPERYTCSGLNSSPPLKWTGVPGATRSLALILDDPDAPGGTFVHWVVYNVSPTVKGLSEGMSESGFVGEQGSNGRSETGYTGPCPPPGTPHHYHFRLYALDQKLQLKPGATENEVEAAMKGHVLGNTELIGVFER